MNIESYVNEKIILVDNKADTKETVILTESKIFYTQIAIASCEKIYSCINKEIFVEWHY